jgi:RNA polymerase sigma-70 factor (ECF subfamily)
MHPVVRYVRDTFTIQEPTLTKRGRTPTGCDTDAFETAFREQYAGLCDYVDSFVRSQEVAHDLVQDLFVNLWDRCDSGDTPPLNAAYLYTAARNRALKHLRHRRVVSEWAESAAHETLRTGPAADDGVRTREVAQAIHTAIDELPERCREIFLLSRQQHLSYAVIADSLGISIKTVETQMWRALKSLRTTLAPYLAVTLAQATGWGSRLFG